MKPISNVPLRVLIPLLGLFISCSSSPELRKSALSAPPSPQEPPHESSIDIQYTLGRDHYRLLIHSTGKTVTAHSSVDKQTLMDGSIDPERYPNFLAQSISFANHYQKAAPEQAVCRAPFIIIIKTHHNSQTVRGCRTNDGGALSKLVRDGEFLLYSKN